MTACLFGLGLYLSRTPGSLDPQLGTAPADRESFVVASDGTTEGYYEYTVDISDSAGTGQFRLLRGPFEGTPVAMADFEANATGDCAPARKLIRPCCSSTPSTPASPSRR